MKVKVYIDSREQDKIQKVIQFWEASKQKFPNIDLIEIKTLATSDICTSDGLFGVERKSSADFIGSILGGKLKQQLHELKQNFKYAFLFVEDYDGIMDCIQKTPQIHPNVIIGATASAFGHSHVPICYVGDFYIPLVLATIEKFLDGKDEQYEKDYTPIRRASTKNEEKMNIMIGLPNIGFTDGEKLLQHFDYKISKIVNASVDELTEVEGIGLTKAQRIKGVFE